MKSLFLFFTQSESGAPQYLSRTGEQGAETLTETIYSFLTTSLKINLDSDFVKRAKSLNEDTIWRSFKEQESFHKACKASYDLFSDVLILAGNDVRTYKTCEALAQGLALPICIDARFDKHSQSIPTIGVLKDAIINFTDFISDDLQPKVVLIGTSLNSLLEWVKEEAFHCYNENFEKILRSSSENDTIPAVLIAGFEKENGKIKWIFDLPNETIDE